MKIPHSEPEEVFKLIESLENLHPCTIEQVRAALRCQWPPIRLAKSFCEYFGLINSTDGKIALTEMGERILMYDGEKRGEFAKNYWRLQDKEPFPHLINELNKCNTPVSFKEIADIIRIKFDHSSKWSNQEKESIGKGYASWLEYLDLACISNNKLILKKGKVRGFDVLSLAEVEYLKERELRDWLIEEFNPIKNILCEPKEVLDKMKSEQDDNKRGRLFLDFISLSFRRLGFIPRLKNHPTDKEHLFSDNIGGGDIVLFFHHPLHTPTKTYLGGAIVCEAKSTEGGIGSGAVGQARNLKKRVKEIFKDYLIQPIIISRSKIGYDPSGIKNAPPEVIHITSDVIIRLLEFQVNRVSSGKNLILPSHIFKFLDEMVKNELIEPSTSNITEFFNKFS